MLRSFHSVRLTIAKLLDPDGMEGHDVDPLVNGRVIDYIPDKVLSRGFDRLLVRLNGTECDKAEMYRRYASSGDHISVLIRPEAGFAGALLLVVVQGAIGFGASYLSAALAPDQEDQEFRVSSTYSGDVVAITRGSGVPRKRVYGRMVVAPHIIDTRTAHAKSSTPVGSFGRSLGKFRSRTLMSLGVGPYHSICDIQAPANYLYLPTNAPVGQGARWTSEKLTINGNPIFDFAGEGHVSLNLGRNYQPSLPGFNSAIREFQVGATLKPNAPQEIETSDRVIGVSGIVFLPHGLAFSPTRGPNQGTRQPVAIPLRIRVRAKGATTWKIDERLVTEMFVANDPTGLTYDRFFDPNLEPELYDSVVQYQIQTDWSALEKQVVVPNLLGEIVFNSYQEHRIGQSPQYPRNVTVATDLAVFQQSGAVERAAFEVEGAETWIDNPLDINVPPIWGYTTNPSPILRDYLLGEYGLGNRYNASNTNRGDLHYWQKRNDELVPDGEGGLMKRWEAGFVIDQVKSEGAWIRAIAAMGEARPYWDGSKVRVIVDEPRELSDSFSVYGAGNIIAGTFKEKRIPKSERADAYDVEFRDETNGFGREMVTAENRDAVTSFLTRKRVFALGTTKPARAQVIANKLLNISKLIKSHYEFETSIEGLTIRPGRLIAIHHHDLDKAAISGILPVDVPGSVSIKFDQQLTVDSPASAPRMYWATVRTTGTGVMLLQSRTLVSQPGVYAANTIINTSPSWDAGDLPKKGDPYIVGPVDGTVGGAQLAVVVKVARLADFRVRVTAVQYDERVYRGLYGTRLHRVKRPKVIDSSTLPPNVGNLNLRAVRAGPGPTQGIEVSWQNPPWQYPFTHVIFVRVSELGGVPLPVLETPTGAEQITLDAAVEGLTYEVSVSIKAGGGLFRAAQAATTDKITLPRSKGWGGPRTL